MKKLLIAIIAASLVFTLSACGGESSEEKESSSKSTAASENNSSEKEDESSNEESDGTDDSDTASSTSADDAPLQASPLVYAADESSWEIENESYTDAVITSLTYIGTEVPDAAEVCNITLSSIVIPGLEEYSMDEIAPIYKDRLGLNDGMTINSEEAGEFNGYEAYSYHGIYTVGEADFDMDIIIAREGSSLMVICPMSYSDVTDAIKEQFDAVLDSVRFS